MLNDEQAAIETFRQYLPIFNALGDSVRQQIMFLLADYQRLSVVELANKVALSRPAVSHHLKILREAKLIEAEHNGAKIYYTPIFQTPLIMSRDFVNALEKIAKRRKNA